MIDPFFDSLEKLKKLKKDFEKETGRTIVINTTGKNSDCHGNPGEGSMLELANTRQVQS